MTPYPRNPTYKIEYFRRLTLRGWRWFFRIRHRNREVVAQSEGVVNKQDLLQTAVNLTHGLNSSTPIVEVAQ